jgi:hypothetical protein
MTLHQALAKAQAEFKPIRFDSQAQLGGGRNYRYASIAAILDGVRPILNKHGILLSQEPSQTDGVVSVTTRLSLGEQSISSTLSAPMSRGGFHELGSAITYLRRYGLASMLGVAAEEDEDGHLAQAPPTKAKAAAAPAAAPRQRAPKGGGVSPDTAAPPAIGTFLANPKTGTSKVGTPWVIAKLVDAETGETMSVGTWSASFCTWIVEAAGTQQRFRVTHVPSSKGSDVRDIVKLEKIEDDNRTVEGIPF